MTNNHEKIVPNLNLARTSLPGGCTVVFFTTTSLSPLSSFFFMIFLAPLTEIHSRGLGSNVAAADGAVNLAREVTAPRVSPCILLFLLLSAAYGRLRAVEVPEHPRKIRENAITSTPLACR